MKTKYTLFRRGGIYYSQDAATGKQTSLRTQDETEALQLDQRPQRGAAPAGALNLHLARAYLTASDPAFVERTWQTVMDQLQARGKDSSRERYASVFKSPAFDGLRHKKLAGNHRRRFLCRVQRRQSVHRLFLETAAQLRLESWLDCHADCRALSLAEIRTQSTACLTKPSLSSWLIAFASMSDWITPSIFTAKSQKVPRIAFSAVTSEYLS